VKPIFNGTLTLTSLRNDIVCDSLLPYGFPPNGNQFRRVSEPVKRRVWQQITGQVADQIGVIFESVSQGSFWPPLS